MNVQKDDGKNVELFLVDGMGFGGTDLSTDDEIMSQQIELVISKIAMATPEQFEESKNLIPFNLYLAMTDCLSDAITTIQKNKINIRSAFGEKALESCIILGTKSNMTTIPLVKMREKNILKENPECGYMRWLPYMLPPYKYDGETYPVENQLSNSQNKSQLEELVTQLFYRKPVHCEHI